MLSGPIGKCTHMDREDLVNGHIRLFGSADRKRYATDGRRSVWLPGCQLCSSTITLASPAGGIQGARQFHSPTLTNGHIPMIAVCHFGFWLGITMFMHIEITYFWSSSFPGHNNQTSRSSPYPFCWTCESLCLVMLTCRKTRSFSVAKTRRWRVIQITETIKHGVRRLSDHQHLRN